MDGQRAHSSFPFSELDDVPNVVPIIDWGKPDDYWALVMPEAEKTLQDTFLKSTVALMPFRYSLTSLTCW